MRTNLVALGELADFVNGAAFKPEDWGESGLPIIRIQNLTDPGKPFNYTERPVPRKLVVEPGDLLVSWSATLGVFQWDGPRGLLNQHIFRVLPVSSIVDRGYLKHALGRAIVEMERHLHGATMKHVNRGEFLGTKIPLPPLEEQRRIATVLDKASQILIASRKADELRRHLLERVFTSMFGDPRENPIGWPKLAIEELTSDYVGGAALAPEDFEDEGVPVLHKGAIKPGGEIQADSKKKGFVSQQTAQNYKRCLAGPGKIAVTLRDLVPSGPFIGLMAELSTTGAPEYLLAQGAYAFKVDARRLLPDYLIALVNMPTFRLVLRQNAVGSTQIHIRLPIFKSIEIPVPPIERQLEFAQVIDRISSLNTLSRRQVRHVDELTRSLHGSSFCGLDA